jgi:hypothetical protein
MSRGADAGVADDEHSDQEGVGVRAWPGWREGWGMVVCRVQGGGSASFIGPVDAPLPTHPHPLPTPPPPTPPPSAHRRSATCSPWRWPRRTRASPRRGRRRCSARTRQLQPRAWALCSGRWRCCRRVTLAPSLSCLLPAFPIQVLSPPSFTPGKGACMCLGWARWSGGWRGGSRRGSALKGNYSQGPRRAATGGRWPCCRRVLGRTSGSGGRATGLWGAG